MVGVMKGWMIMGNMLARRMMGMRRKKQNPVAAPTMAEEKHATILHKALQKLAAYDGTGEKMKRNQLPGKESPLCRLRQER